MQINFTRAFETAWQRTGVILFAPFDPAKYFIIGFNVFLALLAQGAVSVNNPLGGAGSKVGYQSQQHVGPLLMHELKRWIFWYRDLPTNSWLIFWLVAGMLYIVVWLVLNWVGSRAQFMVLDNIVRNRAAIAEPWHRYAHQGNVWFPVSVALSIASWVAFLAVAGFFIALNWPWINGERWPIGVEIMTAVTYGLVSTGLWLIFSVVMFLIYSLALPLYFKQRFGLGQSMLAVGRLCVSFPLEIFLYVLANFVIGFVTAIIGCVIFCAACCLVCWFACIPFVGSMALTFILCEAILPLMIFIRCFQLDCLSQFGPEYDIWSVDVTPVTPPLPPG